MGGGLGRGGQGRLGQSQMSQPGAGGQWGQGRGVAYGWEGWSQGEALPTFLTPPSEAPPTLVPHLS